MPPYDDVQSSSTVSYESGGGRWDAERFARERDERSYRGPAPAAVRERSRPRPPFEELDRRRRDDERFEDRFVEEERLPGPSRRRRTSRFVEEDDFYASRGSGPLVHRHRDDSPPRPPRLIRRQSSLDTFDRQPARRIEKAPPILGVRQDHRRRASSVRRSERDVYEEIDIAEPEFYGDDEFRHWHERDMRRPVREELVQEKIIEKERTYPRKGKTKMPKRLVHARAVQQLGYPYIEEDKVIVIQKALSKELIDEVVDLSREIKRRSETVTYRAYESPSPSPRREREFVERVVVASPPRRHSGAYVVERSPSTHRQRSPSRVRLGRYLEAPEIVEARPRSVSVTYRRPASPVVYESRGESRDSRGQVVLVDRPRHSEHDIREEIRALEEEKRILQIERRPEHVGSVDIINDKIVHRSNGETDETIEIKKDRKGFRKELQVRFTPSVAAGDQRQVIHLLSRASFSNAIDAQFTPFAARTSQFVKEQLGTADEKTQLPDEYVELEKRVDALKQVHQKLLSVTSSYSNEAYDYPPNIRESFNDLGRTISEKVQLLSHASTPAEAQAALTAPPSAKPQPKTFNHAIARASLAGSQLISQSTHSEEDPLASALEKYALALEKVGEARLAQDAQIQSRFLAGWNTTLNTNLTFATKARRNVENSRLTLDSIKANKKAAAGGDLDNLSEDARAEIEQAEDEFVGQTEEAVSVMKNVLDTPEPLRNLADLIAAQLEYHKRAYEILSELAPVVDGLQVEQEASYRKSREGA
ncbi:Protein GVP36 [Talaromyces islandicus]|uniref:Protein GVP36 n=1 Tax=Talaromyces islandicus TaxID=28573 RepID=A0A0U1LTX4_TALIS|nr:Protein GVP36 [Talaromyces islandicus]